MKSSREFVPAYSTISNRQLTISLIVVGIFLAVSYLLSGPDNLTQTRNGAIALRVAACLVVMSFARVFTSKTLGLWLSSTTLLSTSSTILWLYITQLYAYRLTVPIHLIFIVDFINSTITFFAIVFSVRAISWLLLKAKGPAPMG